MHTCTLLQSGFHVVFRTKALAQSCTIAYNGQKPVNVAIKRADSALSTLVRLSFVAFHAVDCNVMIDENMQQHTHVSYYMKSTLVGYLHVLGAK
jgi:hypothetical protein